VEERENEDAGFLPPQPAGPEPELGGRPAPPPAPPPQQVPAAPPPPQPQQTYGYPPQQAWQPPQQAQPPPPGYWQPQTWTQPQQQVPDNGPAVAGFVLSVVAGSLLVLSGGLSTIVSLVCAILGIVYSRKGKRMVAAGETPKHRGLAQAGYIVGWVSLGLSVLAIAFWVLVLIEAINDPDTFDDSNTIRAFRESLGG
jgi:hypothetical protein